MRRRGTALVVAGLVALGIAATVDSLRGEEQAASRPPAPPRASDAEVAGALDAAGVRGLLTYSDERCRLHALRLPTLLPARAPGVESCKPRIPTGGIGTWKGDVVWSGLGYGTVQVVLSRADLTRALRRVMKERGYGGSERYAGRQAVSLGQGRIAVLVEEVESEWTSLAFFERDRLLFVAGPGFFGERDRLRPSPRGTFLAVLDPGEPGIRLFTRDGEPFSLPEVTNPHAIAWSPDERWTALATRWSVYVFPSERGAATIRIPVAGARDLAWGLRD